MALDVRPALTFPAGLQTSMEIPFSRRSTEIPLRQQDAQKSQGQNQGSTQQGQSGQSGQSQSGHNQSDNGSTNGGMKKGSEGGPGAGKKTTPQQRENTLKQNDGKCVVPGCGKDAEHTDHAIPRSRNGDTTDANLQGMCAHHNCQKGDMTSEEYAQWPKDHPERK
jgi:hypothetical protein